MRTLNLGILAHVDAGKTSLTERLLYAAGVIDEIGSVDDGTTQTDFLELERQRGITIKSAVVSFVVDDVTINLIDTPGHPDFIAEVERVLNVLDGAVLVVSAVEGVQPQTRILMRTLKRLRIPTLLFVNKIDRIGAGYDRVLDAVAEKLSVSIVSWGTIRDIGTRAAQFVAFEDADPTFRRRVTEVLAGEDDTFLSAYVEGAMPSIAALRAALIVQTTRAQIHPVFFGSAITGAGVDALTRGIVTYLPTSAGDPDAPLCGTVFKVDRGRAGERIAYVRVFAGTLRTRDRISIRGAERKVTAISVFARGGTESSAAVRAGQIAKLWGLDDVRIGDAIGASSRSAAEHFFAPPTLETVVVSQSHGKATLYAALAQLAEQDPLINLRQDDVRRELYVSLYGEVQKEVIQQTLANDFGIEVEFRETKPICIERAIGTGAALEVAPYPFIATVGLRVEPAPLGSGVAFRLEIPFGALPVSYHKAVEDAVYETLQQGLYGWPVTDCTVTVTHCIRLRDFGASTAAEHRNLTPLVLMDALSRAGTIVCEPIQRFHVECPADTSSALTRELARLSGVALTTTSRGGWCVMEGEIPAAQLHALQQQLPEVTRGEGVLEATFGDYRAVHGRFPTRPRSDANPLNRKEYLLHVKRHVAFAEKHP
jgi:ribosomal protection tetracycline resistance protein